MRSLKIGKLAEVTNEIIDTLNPLEANILRRSFGLESNQLENDGEIAKSLGIPLEFVEEYRKRGLRKLRHPPLSEVVRGYLEQKAAPQKHVEIIVPKAIEEVNNLTPQLLDRLRSKTDDIVKLKPDVFEHLVAELLASPCRKFREVLLVGRNQKTSADIFATKYVDDIGEHRYFIEVKRWKDRIGVQVIDRVYGAMIAEKKNYGWSAAMVVSIVGFKKFSKYSVDDIRNMGIYLKDRDDLLTWLNEYKENQSGLWVPSVHTSRLS